MLITIVRNNNSDNNNDNNTEINNSSSNNNYNNSNKNNKNNNENPGRNRQPRQTCNVDVIQNEKLDATGQKVRMA